jgi:hypothetical protein
LIGSALWWMASGFRAQSVRVGVLWVKQRSVVVDLYRWYRWLFRAFVTLLRDFLLEAALAFEAGKVSLQSFT